MDLSATRYCEPKANIMGASHGDFTKYPRTIGTILMQNKQRDSAVPEAVIVKLSQRCEVPTWAECHELSLGASHPSL